MRNQYDYRDAYKDDYPLDYSAHTPNTYSSYTSKFNYPQKEENQYSSPIHEKSKKDDKYMKLRQTYTGPSSSSNYFKEDLLAQNKERKPKQFLRNTIDSYHPSDSGLKKEQFTSSHVGDYTYGTSSKGDNDYKKRSNRQGGYEDLVKKYQSPKNQYLNEEIRKWRKQHEEKKKNQYKNLDRIIDQTQTNNNNFSKKNYIQYYTPKITKYNQSENRKQVNKPQKNIQNYQSPHNIQGAKTPTKKTTDPIDNIMKKYPQSTKISKYSSPTSKYNTRIVQKTVEEKVNQKNSATKFTINDFYLGKCLGQGKFGSVYLGIHKATNSLFAIKKIPKKVIKSNFIQDQFILEVKLQSFLDHTNIVKIYGFCHDHDNIYLVLEYMQQGTLYSKFKKQKNFSQEETAEYVYQLCQGLEYIHNKQIVHRDIKPQNIVLTNGVCKLCDFGWSTICEDRRTTFCGTFDYAAPQILQQKQYDESVDLWVLGILTYQLMVGKGPFYHISKQKTKMNITSVGNKPIDYPANMSKKAISFIESVLKRNPQERLRVEDLLGHPFLRDVQRQMKSKWG